jgi:hypothetical protein
MREVLAPALAKRGGRDQIERLRQVLLDARESSRLGDEIELVLADGVPRTAPQIARDERVRRRRSFVDDALATDQRFVRVPPPPGRSRLAITWGLRVRDGGRARTSRPMDRGSAA